MLTPAQKIGGEIQGRGRWDSAGAGGKKWKMGEGKVEACGMAERCRILAGMTQYGKGTAAAVAVTLAVAGCSGTISTGTADAETADD